MNPTVEPTFDPASDPNSNIGNISDTNLGFMSRANSNMAIGFDNTTQKVFLLGGQNNEQALYSVQLIDPPVPYDYGTNVTSFKIWVSGQAYTQIGNLLYCFEKDTSRFLQFDLFSQVYALYPTQPPGTFSHYGCLADIDDYIIFTGFTSTWILNLSNQNWITSNTPIINEYNRHSHACVVEPTSGYLYIIGGSNTGPLRTIEKLYVGDMANYNLYEFSTLNQTLSSSMSQQTRAVLFATDIYVIGGGGFGTSSTKNIDVIDTTMDSVSVFGQLHDGIEAAAPILVGKRVYVFGGSATGGPVDYWQYFDMLSIRVFLILFQKITHIAFIQPGYYSNY